LISHALFAVARSGVDEAGAPEIGRNSDIASELKRMAESADFQWITAASDRLAEVERGMRRNLLRSLFAGCVCRALEKRVGRNFTSRFSMSANAW